MKHKPKTVDVMTHEPKTAYLGQPLSEVYGLLEASSFHHVPVLDGRTPVGLISATDILGLVWDVDETDDRMLRSLLDHQFKIEDAMSTELASVRHDEPLRATVDLMSTGAVHSVLVLDDDGQLEGIITSTDLIRELGELL